MITGWQDEIKGALKPSNSQDLAVSLVRCYRGSDSIYELIQQLGSHVSWSLYRDQYPGSAPNSFLSFLAAVQLGHYLQPINHFRAVAQSLWFCSREAREDDFVWDGRQASPGSDLEDFSQRFAEFKEEDRFGDFFAWAVACLDDPEARDAFASWLLHESVGDLNNMGQRFMSISGTIRLLEDMRWDQPENYLLPALHYFFFAPEDRWAEGQIERRLQYHKIELKEPQTRHFGLSGDQIIQIRDAILLDNTEGMLDTLLGALDYGADPFDLAEAMMLTAAHLILSVPYDRWIFPVHGFNFAQTVHSALEYLDPVTQQRLILVAGLYLKRLADSAEPHPLREPFFTERPEQAQPGPNELEEAIDLSIPSDAMAIVDWLYHHGQLSQQFFEQLAIEAVKTDGDLHLGHDMIFAHAAIEGFHHSASPLRQYYLIALVKFLAESEKSREVDHALAQALRH